MHGILITQLYNFNIKFSFLDFLFRNIHSARCQIKLIITFFKKYVI
nr:MAG TPA: hypothetical protein [Caudoviricetes sp.]